MSLPVSSSVLELECRLQGFVSWALMTLGFEVEGGGNSLLATPPRDLWDRFGKQTHRIVFGDPSDHRSVELSGLDCPFLLDLVTELKSRQQMPSARPPRQPRSVREISPQLFGAYDVDGGSVHLSHATLEDRPLFRITCLERSFGFETRWQHYYVDASGRELEAELIASLDLEEAEFLPVGPGEQSNGGRAWSDASRRFVKQLADSSEWLFTTVLWCKYLEGKLAFVIGESMVELPFEGWAQSLAEGHRKPPPYRCPYSGLESYRLTAVAGGRITVQEAVAGCSQSGARVLASELWQCQVTGQRALPEHFVTCPLTGARVLRQVSGRCETCQQLVSPTALRGGDCTACRSLRVVRKDDPRMARLLGEYPRLDGWARWKIAESSQVYILTAGSLMRRLLLVADKESLEVSRIATRSRFSRHWSEVPAAVRDEYLI